MNYYLVIESYENWKIDQKHGFTFFGVTERKLRVAREVQAGDVVLVYVSRPKGGFAGARTVVRDGIYKEPKAIEYERPLTFAISTAPLLTPPETQWIYYRYIGDKLTFVGNPPKKNAFYHSFRKLCEADALHILNALQR